MDRAPGQVIDFFFPSVLREYLRCPNHPKLRMSLSLLKPTARKVRTRVATWLRTVGTALFYLAVLCVVLPLVFGIMCLLTSLLPFVFAWFLLDKMWRGLRQIARKSQSARFRRLALNRRAAVLDKGCNLSTAAAWFSNRPLARLAARQTIALLRRTVRDLQKAKGFDRASIVALLTLEFSNRFAGKDDKIECRRVLARSVYSCQIAEDLRTQCENVLRRDRDCAGYLFAASQIERSKLLLADASPEKWQQSIEVLESVVAFITPEADRIQCAGATSQLATAFWKTWQATKNPQDLDRTIQHATKCVEILDKTTHPADWAVANLNLGIYFSGRWTEVSQEDVERIILCMESALEVLEPGYPNYVIAQKRLSGCAVETI